MGAELLQNGCFSGAFAPTNWVIVSGTVDRIPPGAYASVPTCACGWSLDLAGSSSGTIQQTLSTDPLHYYNVSYYLTGNYNGGCMCVWDRLVGFGAAPCTPMWIEAGGVAQRLRPLDFYRTPPCVTWPTNSK